MAERKDKKKVIGEPMTDEQIKVFLDFTGEEGVNADFHVLEKAYRALRVEDFERFIAFFKEQGRDLNVILRAAPCLPIFRAMKNAPTMLKRCRALAALPEHRTLAWPGPAWPCSAHSPLPSLR